jgi:hypothetical protein
MKRTYIQPEIETLHLAFSEMICGTNASEEVIPGGNSDGEPQPGTADAKQGWMTDFDEEEW